MSEKKHELINQGAGGEKQALGRSGEYKAIQYLDQNGYIILCRNYRCRLGEIDIIASEGKTICFVEVKTRKSLRHGLPSEAVDARKINRIFRCAEVYMSHNRIAYDSMRIDVIEVLFIKGKFYIRHIKNVSA